MRRPTRAGRSRRPRRVGALLLALFAAGVATAAPASAHAELAGSDPGDSARLASAPAKVTLRFSEPVTVDVGYVRVVDGHGARVDSGRPSHPAGDPTSVSEALKPGLGDGSYVVSWRVVSADSHPVDGAYAFVVGDGPLAAVAGNRSAGASVDPAVSTAFGIVRWAGFAGLALLVGGAVFLVLVWPGGQGDGRPRRLLWSGWVLAALSSALSLSLESLYASGQGFGSVLDTSLLSSTLHSTFGRMVSVRLVLLAVLALLLDRALDPTARPATGADADADADAAEGERRWQVDAAALVAVGVFVTHAASGHAAEGIQPPLAVLSNTLHLAAMAVWLGGVAVIAACLLPGGQARDVARALPSFSRLAMVSVATLVVTGVYQAWREVGTFPALWSTRYGLLLTAKLAVFALLIGAGFVSNAAVRRRRTVPVALALAAAPGGTALRHGDGDAPAVGDMADRAMLATLRRSVGLEVLVATAVLAVTAVLITQAPGRDTYSNPYHSTLALPAGGKVRIDVTPARRGADAMTLTVEDHAGRPFDARSVTATASLPDQRIGPLPVTLRRTGTGHLVASGLSFPDSGIWQVKVLVRTSEFDESSVVAKVHVR